MAISTRTAIQTISPGVAEIRRDVPGPRVRPDYVIAETKAWALNPTDNHHIDYLSGPGCIVGCDWAGVVREVGVNVTRFKPGDSVFGVCHGGNTVEPEDGAFSDLVSCKESATMHKPDLLSNEEAASLGVALATVGQALYWVMKLPLPSPSTALNSGPTMLVYGASSSTGTIFIQAAKLSGCRVLATCSAANFELVRTRGADKWYDYNEANFIDMIKEEGLKIDHIVDCIGSDDSSLFCSRILSSTGGHYHSVKAPLAESFKEARPEDSAIATTALGYTMLGERFEFPGGLVFPADPEQETFAKRWILIAENLVRNQHIKPHPVEAREGGLEGVLKGLKELKENPPRGCKLVYKVDDL